MGAFQSGFQMGGNIAQNAMEMANRERELAMREAADARAAEAHGLQMKSTRRIEDATQAVTDAASLGISVPGAQAGNEAAQRESFRRFEIADQNAGDGGERPQYVAPTGIQPTYRPATDLELNGLKSSLAAARGDVQGMETLRLARKGIEYDEGYKKHISDWQAMPDDERAKLIGKLSYDTGVKGFGTWTPGKGKQAGYMTYLPPTGDAVKLSDKEAGEVYALSNLMSIDPTRARGELDKVSDKVRAVAAQVFSAEHQGVTANNQATHSAAADRAAATSANAAATTARAHAAYYGAQGQALTDARNRREEAARIADRFSQLTPEQQAGPEGRGLQREFNMLNIKNGGTVSLADPSARGSIRNTKVEQKPNGDGTFTAFDQATGHALYNTHNGMMLPLGMSGTEFETYKKAAQEAGVQVVSLEAGDGIHLGFIGRDGKPYPTVKEAVDAKATKPGLTPPSASRTTIGGGQSAFTPNRPAAPTRGPVAATPASMDLSLLADNKDMIPNPLAITDISTLQPTALPMGVRRW